jgi:hypothetical protein
VGAVTGYIFLIIIFIIVYIKFRMYRFITAKQSLMYSTYAFTLDTHSAVYVRQICLSREYFYKLLVFTVPVEGTYRFWSNSTVDTFGYLYHYSFHPVDPSRNHIVSNHGGCKAGQFLIHHRLKSNTTYMLVVTTYWGDETGHFSITSAGPAFLDFDRLSK